MSSLLGSEKPSAVCRIIGHTYYILIAGQHAVEQRLSRIPCTAHNAQNESTRDLQPHTLSGGNTLRRSLVQGRLRPMHAVSQGLMTLAEDTRPEAN